MSSHNPTFGPQAQTPEQRARVVDTMKQALPHLTKKQPAQAEQVFARYIAGEITWLQVRQELDTAAGTKGRAC